MRANPTSISATFLAYWRHSGGLKRMTAFQLLKFKLAHFLSGCAIVAEPERTLPFLCVFHSGQRRASKAVRDFLRRATEKIPKLY
jgi:hypothetical protein